MLIGVYIMKLTGLDQFSPPFARGGQGALLSIEAFDVPVPGGGATLAVDVEHKNLEDTTWTVLGSFAGITATGVWTLGVSGCKEQLRFNYGITGGSGTSTFYINVLPPVWRP